MPRRDVDDEPPDLALAHGLKLGRQHPMCQLGRKEAPAFSSTKQRTKNELKSPRKGERYQMHDTTPRPAPRPEKTMAGAKRYPPSCFHFERAIG